ncbi:hypothetical protein [Plantactinospora sp. DSM 117369]
MADTRALLLSTRAVLVSEADLRAVQQTSAAATPHVDQPGRTR